MIWRRRPIGGRNKAENEQGREASPLSTGVTRRIHRAPRRTRPALLSYLLGLATAFLLFINAGAAPPYPQYDLPRPSKFMVQKGLMEALVHSAFRAHKTELEEFYCLIGTVDHDDVYWISGAMRPQQQAETFKTFLRKTAIVHHKGCPVGTLADLHTHPWISNVSHLMSEMDKESARAVDYHAHVILFPVAGGDIMAVVWVRQPDGSFGTVPQR